MKNRYRLTFSKNGPSRFIGHLDLQTLFQRAIKRAGLPVSYSQGFNPHQLISFAQPLPLGMSSGCEIIEIETDKLVDISSMILLLSEALPDGLDILQAELLPPSEKSAGAQVCAARYSAIFAYEPQLAEKIDISISGVLSGGELVVSKRTKKGMKQANIRDDILELKNTSDGSKISIEMKLSAGSEKNLKPDLVAAVICERAGVEYQPHKTAYSRKNLYLK